MSEYESPSGAGWWLASDGRWYPPQSQQPAAAWPYPTQDAARSQRTRMLAVVSLISGLAGIFIMTAFAAIGLGIAVLMISSKSEEHRSTIDIAMAIVGILAGVFWLYLASTVSW